jgi:hypothetical protein
MRICHNKKPSLYRGHEDAEILSRLSKAALLDLLVEQLRLNAGHCDTPCTAAELAELCDPTLSDRADRKIGGGA